MLDGSLPSFSQAINPQVQAVSNHTISSRTVQTLTFDETYICSPFIFLGTYGIIFSYIGIVLSSCTFAHGASSKAFLWNCGVIAFSASAQNICSEPQAIELSEWGTRCYAVGLLAC